MLQTVSGLITLLGYLVTVVRAVGVTVDLTYSKYTGAALDNGVSQWLELRYAAPPVGSLRFEPPQDPMHVDEVQPALQVG